ncbi:MAG: hypothetical protein V4628_15665 [Pseudomonadota bacterium]
MARSEFNRRYLTCQELSLGSLRWRSTSVQESAELADNHGGNALSAFVERLQLLIEQARTEGCTAEELNTILRKHTPGDHDVDA